MKLYFTLQVDCEATQKAVADPAGGEETVKALNELLLELGVKATFAVIPKDLQQSGAVYRLLHDTGHEIGLHIHPAEEQNRWPNYLGLCSSCEQRNILRYGKKVFEDVMGFEPQLFTPGFFSANDYTFALLEELGFTHGSVSLPTRRRPEIAAVWNSNRYAYYPHRYNRCTIGDVNFVDIPVTCDTLRRVRADTDPFDLRVESENTAWFSDVIHNALDDQMTIIQKFDQQHVLYIKALTHNVYDYADVHAICRKNLLDIIAAVQEAAKEKELTLVPASTADIAEAFRFEHPLN
jgi:hypothetical protein